MCTQYTWLPAMGRIVGSCGSRGGIMSRSHRCPTFVSLMIRIRESWTDRLTGSRLFIGLAMALLLFPLVAQAQIVSFNPSVTVPNDPTFTVAIDIDCAGQDVKGVELKVAFDPFLVQLDAVTPGTWYTASGQSHFFFDYTTVDPQGVIHFASAVLDGTLSGTGNLAVCHFTLIGFGVSPLVFQDVDVRGLANLDLGFGHSTGDQILLDPVVEVANTSFGRIKAIYR